MPFVTYESVTIRIETSDDRDGLLRVAERDSRPLPPAPRLVAERDGVIEAVRSLRTGDVVADPFRPTTKLVKLLRCA
jgi:hypothetical protein